MELERNTEELDIKRVLEHYYSLGRYYNRSSQVNLNFEKEENMSGTFTLPQELTNALYGSVVEKIFDEFSGKKVGEEFSIEDVMKHFKVNGSYFEKKKESKQESKKESNKVEGKKEKKKRKMSGYQFYQKKNKEKILEIWKNEKKTDNDIKFLTVASNLWKELGTEEQQKYNLEAKEM